MHSSGCFNFFQNLRTRFRKKAIRLIRVFSKLVWRLLSENRYQPPDYSGVEAIFLHFRDPFHSLSALRWSVPVLWLMHSARRHTRSPRYLQESWNRFAAIPVLPQWRYCRLPRIFHPVQEQGSGYDDAVSALLHGYRISISGLHELQYQPCAGLRSSRYAYRVLSAEIDFRI